MKFKSYFSMMAVAVTVAVLSQCKQRAETVTTHPFAGVTLVARKETVPRNIAMHVIIIDLQAAGIRFKLTPGGGTRETIRQSTLDFLKQEKAQIAINVHFYLPFTTPDVNANLVGLAVSDGVIISPFEPQPIAPTYTDQSYAILPFAPALNIDSSNRASIVHHDPAFPDNKHILEPATLWTAVSGSAQIISNGVKTIPTYTGKPGGLNSLNGYSNANSWYFHLRGRTAIGLTAENRHLVLFTVDETGGSAGMTVDEMADLLLRDYGVQNALNLDGNGSTSMAIEDPVSRAPRLLSATGGGPLGKAIGSNLAVFALPAPDSPRKLAIARTLNNVVISWLRSEMNAELESSASLKPIFWQKASEPSREVGGFMQVILPKDGDSQFFRLSQ